MNSLHDLYRNIDLTAQLALENFEARNIPVDHKLDGVCNHYFPSYDWEGNRFGEIVLSCRVKRTVQGQLRYTWRVNGARIAKREIDHKFISLGAFRNSQIA